MATARGRGLRPGGVVRALVRLVFLVAVGFGVGLVFGVVLEEPELLAAHLFGESRSVGLANDATSGADPSGASAPEMRPLISPETRTLESSLPGVAAAARGSEDAQSATGATVPRVAVETAAAESAAAERAASERAAAKRRPAAAPVPDRSNAATKERRWAIQVGAFADAAAADRLAEGLRSRYPVAVLPARDQGGRWRVRIQPVAGESEARTMADRLKRDERLPTWVTPMEASGGS